MRKVTRLFFLAAILGAIVSAAPPAHAILSAVGPVDPATGFPTFYTDTNAVKLKVCVDRLKCPIDPTGAERFWFRGVAVGARGGCTALVTLAVEGIYITPTGLPAPGRESAMARIDIKVQNLPVAGLYTVTHPYGTQTFNVVPDAKGLLSIKFRKQAGGGRIKSWTVPLRGPVGPFFTQVGHPPGFLGNINLSRRIVGGPNGNVFTVTGPTGVVIKQPLWAVCGQKTP
jgi:hypothetical protein